MLLIRPAYRPAIPTKRRIETTTSSSHRRPSSLVLVLPFFVAPMFSRPRRKRTPGDIIATTAASKWRIPGREGDGWMERNEIEGGALSFLRLMAEIAFELFPCLVAGTVSSIVRPTLDSWNSFPLHWDISRIQPPLNFIFSRNRANILSNTSVEFVALEKY